MLLRHLLFVIKITLKKRNYKKRESKIKKQLNLKGVLWGLSVKNFWQQRSKTVFNKKNVLNETNFSIKFLFAILQRTISPLKHKYKGLPQSKVVAALRRDN